MGLLSPTAVADDWRNDPLKIAFCRSVEEEGPEINALAGLRVVEIISRQKAKGNEM